MFSWDDIRFFLELSRKGRLITAAQRLHVDHTTVSRRIAVLEQALDTRLFDKKPAGYQLTEMGRRLLPFAEAMEAQSFAVTREISGKDAMLTGTVRLAAPEGLGSELLARHLYRFRLDHPGIELELIAGTQRTSLSKREADIAITLARPEEGRLIAWKLSDYSLHVYAARKYLDKHPPINHRQDLEGHDFIGYIEDLLQMPELRYLEKIIKDPNVVFKSNNVLAQYNAAVDGVGLALLHDFMAAGDQRLAPVLHDEVKVLRSYWLVVHEDLRHVARVDAVCRFLTRLLQELQPLLLNI
jgi:DNA-binding transcriptional LysR family regulator